MMKDLGELMKQAGAMQARLLSLSSRIACIRTLNMLGIAIDEPSTNGTEPSHTPRVFSTPPRVRNAPPPSGCQRCQEAVCGVHGPRAQSRLERIGLRRSRFNRYKVYVVSKWKNGLYGVSWPCAW